MPKAQPSSLTKVCRRCGELKPLRLFERRLTARQVISNYERLKAAGALSDEPDVLEFTAEDRAWAADQVPTLTLTQYKLIRSPLVESPSCLSCLPQAPFEGRLHTPAERLNALYSGALAPTVERSKTLLDAKLAERRGKVLASTYKTSPFVALKTRCLDRLRGGVADELRAARNKLHYFQRTLDTRPEPPPPEQLACLRAYITLTQAVHTFLFTDMQRVPGVVWQIALRSDNEVLWVGGDNVLAVVAMACRDPSYVHVAAALLRAEAAYEAYLATTPKNALRFAWLELLYSQEDAIQELHEHMSAVIKQARGGERAQLLAEQDPNADKGIPRLEALLEVERARISDVEQGVVTERRPEVVARWEAEDDQEQPVSNAAPPAVSSKTEALLNKLLDDDTN